jgi:hypothetical protein
VVEYQASVATFCETAPTGPLTLEFFDVFDRYSEENRRNYVKALTDYHSAMRRRLKSATGKRPPEELIPKWEAEQRAEARYLRALRRYTNAVDDARQIRLDPLPGSLQRQQNRLQDIAEEFRGELVALSGGGCDREQDSDSS